MEKCDAKMATMGMMILSLILQKDYISQSRINVFVKEIVAKHRDKTINGMYENLEKEFCGSLTGGPGKFIDLIYNEIDKPDHIDSVNALCDQCPLITYGLITEVKLFARFGICQSVNNRICNAYVAAVQSLDALA